MIDIDITKQWKNLLLFSTFFHKFCPAFWTGNTDFSSAFWHSHFLFTLRTFVKSVVFSLCQMLFEPIPLHSHLISVVEIFLIFCISCGNILREHSPCGIDHQCDRQPVKNAKTAEHRQKKQYQCSNALCLCQFIRPISSNHKTLYFLPHCSDLLSSDFMLRFKGNRVNTPIVF